MHQRSIPRNTNVCLGRKRALFFDGHLLLLKRLKIFPIETWVGCERTFSKGKFPLSVCNITPAISFKMTSGFIYIKTTTRQKCIILFDVDSILQLLFLFFRACKTYTQTYSVHAVYISFAKVSQTVRFNANKSFCLQSNM